MTKREYTKIIGKELAFEIHEFYFKIKDLSEEDLSGIELDEICPEFANKWREHIPRGIGRIEPESFGVVKTILGDEFKYIGQSNEDHIFEINGKKF